MSPPYDALSDLARSASLLRQNAIQALQPLPNGQQLQLVVEDEHWLLATLPLGISLASLQAMNCLGEMLHTQHLLPGGVKFAAAANHGVLALHADLPLQPRALLHQRWQALQHGVVQGIHMFTRLCQGSAIPQCQPQESLTPAQRDDRLEHLQALLQEGGWQGTLLQHTIQVTLQLQTQEYRLTLLHKDDNDTWQCRLHFPLPATLPAVCSQALHTFLLEGNTRVRLARFGILMGQTPSVIAEVHLHADGLDVHTLGQALHATAVAAHVLWPVLPALLTAAVARLYLHTRPAAGAGAGKPPLWPRLRRGGRDVHNTAQQGEDLCQPL